MRYRLGRDYRGRQRRYGQIHLLRLRFRLRRWRYCGCLCHRYGWSGLRRRWLRYRNWWGLRQRWRRRQLWHGRRRRLINCHRRGGWCRLEHHRDLGFFRGRLGSDDVHEVDRTQKNAAVEEQRGGERRRSKACVVGLPSRRWDTPIIAGEKARVNPPGPMAVLAANVLAGLATPAPRADCLDMPGRSRSSHARRQTKWRSRHSAKQ